MNHQISIKDTKRWKNEKGDRCRFSRLYQRQEAIRTIREDLYENRFIEIETPLLLKSTCPDLHIDSIQTEEGYLATSTEYQIKRLIVGGFQKVFTLTKNFRANDRGRYHSNEFTMLEWARANESLTSIEEDSIRFIKKAFQKLHPNKTRLNFNGHTIAFINHDWERLTVKEAFKIYLKIENLHDFSLISLLDSCKNAKYEIPVVFQKDKYLILSYLFDQLQPHLGTKTPLFLNEWPAYLTTSAPICQNDPYMAERSELYIGGIEIADGFPFLTDPELQEKLFNEELRKRKELEKDSFKIDKVYLEALKEGLPEGAGMALGIDRLIMVLTGSECLSDVQAFDWSEL